jgi:(p)ppGpp synthase/HD superfamily hydrolase
MIDINCWEKKIEHCFYSARLLKKLYALNEQAQYKIDFLEVRKAIYYAKKYHGKQKRQSGEPYYSHPLEVAYRVADYCFKTDILVTSILHDTIEDTKLTEKMLGCIFNTTIATQVEALTRIKIDGKISAAETVKLLWHQKNRDLLLIKIFDRLHNMQTIQAKSSDKIEKTTSETIEIFLILAAYLEVSKVEVELKTLCCNNSKPLPIQHEFVYEGNMRLPFLTVQSEISRRQSQSLMVRK